MRGKRMAFLFVRLRPSWGFAARLQPQSKMRMAFTYPPPTTLIGALAYPLVRCMGQRREIFFQGREQLSMAEKLRNDLKVVATSSIGRGVIYGSYLKVNRYYRGSVEPAVTALPSMITLGEREKILDIVYVTSREIDDKLLRAGWGITRIGSRESIYSVEEVFTGKEKEKETSKVNTRFSFRLNTKMQINGRGTIIYVVDWKNTKIGDYKDVERVPYFYPEGEVTVRSEGFKLKVLELNLPWGKEGIII